MNGESQALAYDMEKGLEKLKSFAKIEGHSKFKAYFELEDEFDVIASRLEKSEIFNDKLNYFLLITDEILYIIHQNCKNDSIGHLDFALELFDFFVEIWNSKLELINDSSEEELKKFSEAEIEFKERYHEYRREFYWNIYEYSDDFDERKTYEFAKGLKA